MVQRCRSIRQAGTDRARGARKHERRKRMCDKWQGICQERYDSAAEKPASELLLWDVILPIPNNGPWGPWEVREVRGAYMSTTRVDIVSATETWFGVPSDRTYRVERLGAPRGYDACGFQSDRTSERV